ncbi:hypothetical protein BGW36DRAFT_217820 [Talaromyces proteolyticus]|uniref:Membrane anchor Opy2 N-terminal domain-containing protein n=1 Tax=Talaromyces proteolyticus TaxID=1131652 RepID=A0AAD4KQA1_9EURO|nr:uncharacterized protein BGW36DRAFT_217820 [Talaromyces proteolyticus]KAH8694188.1 hypothetical protein BGW36DRAFT_217820 [Talaromyces proteolyticus]
MATSEFVKEFSPRSTVFDRRCIGCDPTTCNCQANETCEVSSRTCDQCPTVTCIPNTPTPTPSSGGGGGSNAGAIAGGVIGGLACIGIITFLFWWFVVRKRRQAESLQPEKNNTPGHQRSRSMQSIASTVLTRASNVIQIAYIPGVTNRSEPHTPGTLVPPVPPLPSAHGSMASNDQYLFTPSDLRASQYSAMTSDRRSIATSLARSSIATTIYRNDAIISPMPAQQARAAKAAMVSVKSGTNTPTDNVSLRTLDAPAVPAITNAQLQKAGVPHSSIVARSVVARPVNVKASSKPKVPVVSEEEIDSDSSESIASHSRGKRFDNQNSKFEDSSDDEDDGSTTPTGPSSQSIQISLSEGPFSDQPRTPSSITITHTAATPTTATSPSTAATTTQTIPDETPGPARAGQRSSLASVKMLAHESATQRSSSPFDDEHEVK